MRHEPLSSSANTELAGQAAASDDHPVRLAWSQPERGILDQIAAHMRECGAHPARTVVLLPYAQLMPMAARLWAERFDEGFAPRFETTQNWSQSLAGFAPGPTDIAFDTALDLLNARVMVERAGLGGPTDALAMTLLEMAHQLGGIAAAVPVAQRADWGARMQPQVAAALQALPWESAVAQLAVVWAAQSSYASDVLLAPHVVQQTECLVLLQGFQPDPLVAALQTAWGPRMKAMSWREEAVSDETVIGFHAARDAQDEAQRAAACVLQHINAGRLPVALVATDRALTRRIQAMLAASGAQLRDETGWKLSTSRAGAHVIGALRACAWHASSDAVLGWLKNAPAFEAAAVQALEAELRRQPVRDWRSLPASAKRGAAVSELLARVEAWRGELERARTLPQWLHALRDLLERSGQWALLVDDAAGDKLMSVLRLSPAAAAAMPEAGALWAGRRWSQAEFVAWVNQGLESASFKPAYPRHEQVAILPLSQMLGRSFGAVVLPGCDEVRLSPSPEPPGLWPAALREALGLPTREQLALAQRAAWAHALQTPQAELLWRQGDEGGEPLLPSALVQLLQLQRQPAAAADPRGLREVQTMPLVRPSPVAPQLDLKRLSASAYGDLRQCPYRFFALRQLGLKEVEELDSEVDKRDFGLWLHEVLQNFHERLAQGGAADLASRRTLLDEAAQQVTQSQRLAEDEFLPFLAAWPRLREGYLEWLAGHEAQGQHFAEGERWQEQPLGELTLVGRIDRIDRAGGGDVMLIDYKTESPAATAQRMREPLEDTQLAFYAALLPHDTLRAAYVNVSEKEGTKTYELEDVVAVRDALIDGILHDLQRVADGAPLPALGEGDACGYCAARGLCRRDFWSES